MCSCLLTFDRVRTRLAARPVAASSAAADEEEVRESRVQSVRLSLERRWKKLVGGRHSGEGEGQSGGDEDDDDTLEETV